MIRLGSIIFGKKLIMKEIIFTENAQKLLALIAKLFFLMIRYIVLVK